MRFQNQKQPRFSLDRDCFKPHYEAVDDLVGLNLNLEMEMSEPELCASLQECQKSKTVRFAGTWCLAPSRAMSLWPRRPGQILIVQGSAWITWTGTRSGPGLSGVDQFVHPGEILEVPAGVHLVMEALNPQQTVRFDWREWPEALVHTVTAAPSVRALHGQWWQALGQLGWATNQLVRGVAIALSGWRAARLPA